MRNNAVNSLGTLGPYVVGADLGCNYNSIQSAITAAAVVALTAIPLNVYIKPGVYVEDLTLAPNVNLIGLGGTLGTNSASQDGNMPIQIQGGHSCNFTGTQNFTFETIQFTQNNASNNALFTFDTGSSATASIMFSNCKFNDGGLAPDLFSLGSGSSLACTAEFFDCAFKQVSSGNLFAPVPTAGFNQTIVCSHCLLFCNRLTYVSGTIFATYLFNDCSYIGNGQILINSQSSDINSYTFTNCTLSGGITSVTSTSSYTFNNCRMTSWSYSGTGNEFSTVFMNDCQVTTSTSSLPDETTFPVGTLVTIENCWFTANNLTASGTIQVLVNKTHPVASLATVFFTGSYKYEVQVAATSSGNTPLRLLQIPVDIPCSTMLNVAIVGNQDASQPSTTSGFIQAAYYLPTGGGSTPTQNFITTNVATTGLDPGSVAISLAAGFIRINATGTVFPYFWYAVVTWENVFENT